MLYGKLQVRRPAGLNGARLRMDPNAFDSIPLLVLFVGTVVVTLAAIAAGVWFGRRSRARIGDEATGPVGGVVGATSGLLAFMLAFTFGGAASRFDARKDLLLDEVNAIGTSYVRASLIPEPHRSGARRLLREYVDLRAGIVPTADGVKRVLQESARIHARLWSHAEALAAADRSSEIDSLFIASLNDVFDLHTSRATVALHARVVPSVWLFLLLITLLAMGALGYDFGLSGSRRYKVTLVLALTFAAVIVLIADLDRPGEGMVRVSQQPMLNLQRQMHADEN